MKSRATFFDWEIARSFLRRFWPIWVAYFVLLILMLPIRLSSGNFYEYYPDEVVLPVRTVFPLDFFTAAAVAMAMLHYLTQTQNLPQRRGSLFFTVYLEGLLPLLLAQLLTAVLTFVRGNMEQPTLVLMQLLALLHWLALSALCLFCFYNFAVYCGMLTGRVLLLPLVYLVLNFSAYLVEGGIRIILDELAYGLSIGAHQKLTWLSPPVWLFNNAGIYSEDFFTSGVGFALLLVYAVLSIFFLLTALWLFCERKPERSLKPVFKYGTSLVTAMLVVKGSGDLLFRYSGSGWPKAFLILALLLIGAFIGYFASEMLIQKRLRVFRGHWKGLLATAALIAALLLAIEADAFGFERYQPRRDSIRSVYVTHNGSPSLDSEEPENIEAALALHRLLIGKKTTLEAKAGSDTIWFSYRKKYGITVYREYYIPNERDNAPELYDALQELLNCPEATQNRIEGKLQYKAYTKQQNTRPYLVEGGRVRFFGFSKWTDLMDLTQAQAEALAEALLADAREGKIGKVFLNGYGAADAMSSVSLHLILESRTESGREIRDATVIFVDLTAERTIRYLTEELGLAVVPAKDRGLKDKDYFSDYLYYRFYDR